MLPLPGGIFFKNTDRTSRIPIQNITPPDCVYIDIPKGYQLNVSSAQHVLIGEIIASHPKDSMSPIYSSISGSIELSQSDQSDDNITVSIKNDFKDAKCNGTSPLNVPLGELSDKDIESIVKRLAIYNSNVPLFQKIHESCGKIENVIVSCTCSEPLSNPFKRISEEYTEELIGGIKILIHATKARMGIIVISESANNLTNHLKSSISDNVLITVRNIENKYPIENEKYLLYALTRREYQSDSLTQKSRSLILNSESVVELYRGFTTGIPSVNKIISVSGYIKESKNISVPLGTKFSHVLDYCGGITIENPIIINGGIMSGKYASKESVVTHDVNSISIIQNSVSKEYHCIRCGKCLEACPMLLKPLYLYSNIVSSREDNNIRLGINHCIECGCCSYVCPSKLPLCQTIKTWKQTKK